MKPTGVLCWLEKEEISFEELLRNETQAQKRKKVRSSLTVFFNVTIIPVFYVNFIKFRDYDKLKNNNS